MAFYGAFALPVPAFGRKPPKAARVKIAARHQVEFFRQMELLLSSGVLISEALGRLKDRYPDARTRRVLREVHGNVTQSRGSLSQALAGFPRSFPRGVITVIQAGEEGGAAMLAERFGDLADRIAYAEASRRRIRQACAYPAFVVALALALQALLLGVVFPRLTDLLASLGGGLPPLARHIIAASALVRRWWPEAAGLAAALPLGIAAARRIPAAGLWTDRAFLRLPLIGGIYRDLTVALVCKVYRSLYRANKSAPEIVESCARLVANRALQRGLLEARRRISSGGASLTQALGESGLFPPLACLAIDVGEQSGRIAEAMDRVAGHFDARARERIAAAIAVLHPALTLAVVGGMALVLLAFFQALYQVVYAVR